MGHYNSFHLEYNLEAIFSELNQQYFENKLPFPVLAWNSRLSSSAGRFAPGNKFHPARIEIASYLAEIAEAKKHVYDTMLHEMIHHWLWVEGKPYGHTKEFYKKMHATGASRYNTVPKSLVKTQIQVSGEVSGEKKYLVLVPESRKEPEPFQKDEGALILSIQTIHEKLNKLRELVQRSKIRTSSPDT